MSALLDVPRTSTAGRRWTEVSYRDQRDYACRLPNGTGYYWSVIQGHPLGCWPAASGYANNAHDALAAAQVWKAELDRRAALAAAEHGQ